MTSISFGVIGVGRMGAGIAQRALAAGHSVVVTDPDEAAVAAPVANGASAALCELGEMPRQHSVR